ncbi:MAG TPA: phosphate signaling complex protein PhoU [Polyangia bacterium]|nr:phosphate signaling complex protein PhoU [Polyangia bacterium]
MIEPTDREFAQELRTIRVRMSSMAQRASEQIVLAIEALEKRNDGLAQRVIEHDRAINQDENEIDKLAMQILMARHPVASDLRFVTMALKFVVDIERIGDLAKGIARRALELNRLTPLDWDSDLTHLAVLVHKNLQLAIDSFVNGNSDEARAVIRADAEIDRANANTFAQLVALVATDPATVTHVLPLTSVSRYLERIGDHVKNVAEEVIFMVSGAEVRHEAVYASN